MVEDTARKEKEIVKTMNSRDWREAPSYYRAMLQDLFSDRAVTVKKVDLTTAALEGAFVGVAAASIIAAIVRGG